MHSPAGTRGAIAFVVAASSEWKVVRARFPDATVEMSPYGEWFEHRLSEDARQTSVFFQSGCGKVAAAGATQYAIDRCAPRLVVNVGTCGGFGDARVGDIVLARETVIYDIVEQMGDPAQAIADYSTKLDVSLWPEALRDRVRVERMLSADRDLVLAEVPRLREEFQGVTADWESGAIAWVCARNRTPVLVLRVVTDVMTEEGNPTYGNISVFHGAAKTYMTDLLSLAAAAVMHIA